MITKDGRDTAIENLTASNYAVPKGEERYYHAVIEVKQFDPKTGKRLSTPRVQKFGKKIFETYVLANLKKQGYEVTILHNPNEWIKEHQAKAVEAAKAVAEAKAKAEQERIDAAVAKATAELEKKYAEREKEIGRLLQELEQRKEAEAETDRKAEQEVLLEAEVAKAEAEAKEPEQPAEKKTTKAK